MSLVRVLSLVPLSYVSWFLGALANFPLPQPLARWTVSAFARLYGIDTSISTKSLDEFRCIGEFFTRDVKPEARPCAEGLVSPVDGTLRSYHQLSPDKKIPQVKGRNYTLTKLLGGDAFVSRVERGSLWNMYLSPADVHHIYSPVSGLIVRTVHIPGKLWPVNDWALHSIDELFAVNERVVTYIETDQGLVGVVMVGATNVGRIALQYMPLETNVRPWEHKSIQSFDHGDISIRAGMKIGTFKMGSSVLVITESPSQPSNKLEFPRKVLFGEPL